MSFPEVAGAAVVAIVVISGMIARARRGRGRPSARNPGIAALEAMVEERSDGADGSTDLRALLAAARGAHVEPEREPAATITFETAGDEADLRKIFAAARELRNARTVDVAQTPPTHEHHRERRAHHVAPAGSFDGSSHSLGDAPARPPLGEMPALPPLHAKHAQRPYEPMQPLAAIQAR